MGDLDGRAGLSQNKGKSKASMLKRGFIKSGKLELFRPVKKGQDISLDGISLSGRIMNH